MSHKQEPEARSKADLRTSICETATILYDANSDIPIILADDEPTPATSRDITKDGTDEG